MTSEKSFIVECNYCDVESEIYAETQMSVEYPDGTELSADTAHVPVSNVRYDPE